MKLGQLQPIVSDGVNLLPDVWNGTGGTKVEVKSKSLLLDVQSESDLQVKYDDMKTTSLCFIDSF